MKELLRIFKVVTLSAVVQALFYTVYQTTRPEKKLVSCGLTKLRDEDSRLLGILTRDERGMLSASWS